MVISAAGRAPGPRPRAGPCCRRPARASPPPCATARSSPCPRGGLRWPRPRASAAPGRAPGPASVGPWQQVPRRVPLPRQGTPGTSGPPPLPAGRGEPPSSGSRNGAAQLRRERERGRPARAVAAGAPRAPRGAAGQQRQHRPCRQPPLPGPVPNASGTEPAARSRPFSVSPVGRSSVGPGSDTALVTCSLDFELYTSSRRAS